MQFIFFKNNKRGFEWTLINVVELVLVAFLIIIFSGFINNLNAAVFSQKDDGSKANFQRLYSDAKKLIESSQHLEYIDDENYFISEKHILVGFDTEWDDSKKIASGAIINYDIYKPFKCGNSACLCLYTKSWKPNDAAKRDQGIVDCRSEAFAYKNVVFLGEAGNVEPKTRGLKREDTRGNYLVLYGEEWGVQPIYIEKEYRKDENKYYIYISKISKNSENDPASARKKQIDISKKSS